MVVELLFRYSRNYAISVGVDAASAVAAAAAAAGTGVDDATSAKIDLKIGVYRAKVHAK